MAFSIPVEIEMPTPERIEEIFREECAKKAAELATWFDARGAAEYLRVSLPTFKRRWKKDWKLPRYEERGIKRFWRPDLDAHRLRRMVRYGALQQGGSPAAMIEFPSVIARNQLLKGAAA